MNGMHRLISRRTFMILFNICGLLAIWADGHMSADVVSFIALVLALAIINALVWRSTKEYPDWK